jgi:hypothetical protein
MSKRKSAQGLLLAIINVAVIVGVTFVIQSLAAEDPAPSSTSSFDFPNESEFAFPSPADERTAFTPRGSSSASASPSSAKGQNTSEDIVAAITIDAQASPTLGGLEFDQLWDGQADWAHAPFLPDSESSWQPGLSASGYGPPSSAPAFGRRSGLSTGYAGMGGGFSPSGGGSRGKSRSEDSASSGEFGSSDSGASASAAGEPLLPTQALGNPLFGGGTGGPLPFPLTQFPGRGPAGLGTSLTSPNQGGGASANVTQLEPVQVPEPSTALLLGCGVALAAYRNRRRVTSRA